LSDTIEEPTTHLAAGATAAASRRTGRPRIATARRTRPTPYVLLAPAVLLFVLFFAIPLGYAVYLSLFAQRASSDPSGFGVAHNAFVWLANYADVFRDSELLASFERLGLYALITIPFTMGFALVFALLLDSARIKFERFSRMAIFMPYAVPGAIAGIMWGFLYLPTTSPVNTVLSHLGVDNVNLLGKHAVFGALANTAVWGVLGFNMIIIYTGLRAISSEIYDSARVDGCSEIRLALRIKIPMIVPSLVLTGLFALIGTLQTYTEPTVIAPLTTSISSTFFPLMNVYRDAFTTNQTNLSAAMSIVIAAGTLILSMILLRLVSSRAFAQEA
jgi:multiple sugar transport system permease protein